MIKMDTTDPRVPGYSGRAAATAGTAPHEKQRKKHKKQDPKKRKKQRNRQSRKRLAPKKWVATLLASGVPTSDINRAFQGKSSHRLNKDLAIWRKDASLTGIGKLGGDLPNNTYKKMQTALVEARTEEAA